MTGAADPGRLALLIAWHRGGGMADAPDSKSAQARFRTSVTDAHGTGFPVDLKGITGQPLRDTVSRDSTHIHLISA